MPNPLLDLNQGLVYCNNNNKTRSSSIHLGFGYTNALKMPLMLAL